MRMDAISTENCSSHYRPTNLYDYFINKLYFYQHEIAIFCQWMSKWANSYQPTCFISFFLSIQLIQLVTSVSMSSVAQLRWRQHQQITAQMNGLWTTQIWIWLAHLSPKTQTHAASSIFIIRIQLQNERYFKSIYFCLSMLSSVTYILLVFFFFVCVICEWPSDLIYLYHTAHTERVNWWWRRRRRWSRQFFLLLFFEAARARACGTIQYIKFNIIYNEVRLAWSAAAAQPN